MSLSLRAWATRTSWPHSSSTRLTQREWMPDSMAMRMGSSEAKRRLKASGIVRSMPSSIISPRFVLVDEAQGGRSSCGRDPESGCHHSGCSLCYQPWWADPALPCGRKSPYSLCGPSKGYFVSGGSAFSSHLLRTPLLRTRVNKAASVTALGAMCQKRST
jgi:hypothetical protein